MPRTTRQQVHWGGGAPGSAPPSRPFCAYSGASPNLPLPFASGRIPGGVRERNYPFSALFQRAEPGSGRSGISGGFLNPRKQSAVKI